MARKKKEAPVVEEEQSILIELPSYPNFPYQPRKEVPPKGVVLILECEGGYVLGDWDGVYFMDSAHTKIEPHYGKVGHWCVFLDSDGKFVPTDPPEEDG